MIKTIELTNSVHYSDWAQLIRQNRYDPSITISELNIDFSSLNFIHPYTIVSIACLIEEYSINNIPITFNYAENSRVANYLTNIRFFEYWQPNFNRDSHTRTINRSNLCLWHISQPMMEFYIIRAREFYQNNHFDGRDLFGLFLALAELFNNIFDHSGSPIQGYTMTQYFPRNNRITIAVCDFGVGIANKVNNYLADNNEQVLEDSAAIKKALESSFSTKSQPHNRGYGLDNLPSSGTGGLHIFANSGRLSFYADGAPRRHRLTIPYDGTLVLIHIDTNDLPLLEEEFVIDELNF